jgi:amino acid transporter
MSEPGSGAPLTPVLRSFRVIAIALAAISPTTSVFLVYGAGLAEAGTGLAWSFVLAAVIAISMAFAYAELGSVHLGAGGAYTIVREVLGDGFGFIALALFLVLGVLSTAAILVASATYLHQLIGDLPVKWTAVAMMAVITGLSLERLGSSSWVATMMLAVELVVIGAFIVACLISTRHGLGFITHPVLPKGKGPGTVPVGFSALLPVLALALFAYNGYDWPLYFGEETHEPRRVLPRAVMVAAVSAVVIEIVAVVVATLAIHDLGATAASASPLATIAATVAGNVGSKILLAGVVVAMFDTGLSANLGYARIYFASGRDHMWPAPVSRALATTNRNQVPKWAFAFLGVACAVFCYLTGLTSLITFTSVMIVTVYLLIATAAIVSRLRERDAERSFRMPLWPLPPVLAIVGIGLTLRYQKFGDIIITLITIAIALIYWLAYLNRNTKRAQSSEPNQA